MVDVASVLAKAKARRERAGLQPKYNSHHVCLLSMIQHVAVLVHACNR